MRKLGFLFLGAILSFGCVSGARAEISASAEEKKVYIGGMSAGFTLKIGGAQVIGLSEVITEKGTVSPALTAGIRAGDKIQKIQGIRVNSIAELNEIVEKSKGGKVEVELLRAAEILAFSVIPVKEAITGKYKIGVLVRDSVSGIGTVTYIDQATGKFGALGHPVTDNRNQNMQLSDGTVYTCSIVGVSKGVRGKAGELRGMFLNDKCFGTAEKICECGIFGHVSQEFKPTESMLTVANSTSAKPGNAVIYSTVNGMEVKCYDIEIVKVEKNNKENKNYVLKIKDEGLISETGGIVQGMSGSPILQDGCLIGAVTHVFLNDPTRGYGIDINQMLAE